MDSAKIRAELLALQERYPLLPRHVIHDWAQSHPNSELHKALLWNDKEAGYQYRLVQISNLVSVHVKTEQGVREMHALSVDYKAGGGYRHLNSIMSDATMRDVLLKDAFEDFERFRQKYETLRDLASVFAEMKKVKKRAQKRKGRSKPAKVRDEMRTQA